MAENYTIETDIIYEGNGTVKEFPITFSFSDENEVVVYLNGEVIRKGYSIYSDSVVFNVAPVDGDEIALAKAAVDAPEEEESVSSESSESGSNTVYDQASREHIKINPVPAKIKYSGNGEVTEFPTGFAFFENDNIIVYLNGAIINSGYSITGVGETEGGSVIFDEAPKEGDKIVILRQVAIERVTDFQEGGAFRAKNINDELDRQTAFCQQIQEQIDRCVKVEVTDDQTPEELLAEVYGKLDSATEVAQEAVDAANAATDAVASAEKTLAEVNTYVDESKAEIDALIAKTTEEIDQTISDATEEIKEVAVNAANEAVQETIGASVIEAATSAEHARIWAEGEQAEVKPLGGELSSMGAADLAYAIANAPEDTPIDASGLFAMNVVKGPKGDKGDKGDDGKDGGGLEIGDIAFAALGIDESKNLRRYLNGQVISQSQFQSFAKLVKERVALYPSLAATEENWQAEVTNSKLGQCGKFVVDDELGTIRLPKVVNIQGLADLSLMGNIKAESLPNITGKTNAIFIVAGQKSANGCFGGMEFSKSGSYFGGSYADSPNWNISQSGGEDYTQVKLDASRSSSTYQDNAPVQQEAVQYPYFIQVATGVEETVDVTREIELNNPFSLLDYKWSEYELNNASWLISNGAFHSGTVYKSVYELLLKIHNGTETKDGVSVKMSTEAYTNTDFVLNTTDTTFRLPIKVKLASGNAVVGNGMTLGLTNGTENFGVMSNTNLLIQNSSAFYGTNIGTKYSNIGGITKDLSVGVTTDPTKSGLVLADNDMYLYFYVGETIQDANVINASGVLTRVAELSDSYISGLGMPSDKYINLTLGASGSTYTAPANGYFYFGKVASGVNQFVDMLNQTSKYRLQTCAPASGIYCLQTIPARKGDLVRVNYNLAGATEGFRFIYAEGE